MLTWFLNILLFISTADNSFNEKLENYLSSKLSNFEKWNFEIVSKDKKRLNNFSNIKIDLNREFIRQNCFGYIPIKISESENCCSSSFLTVKLNLYLNVLQVSGKIKINSKLLKEDFNVVLVDITAIKGTPFTNIYEISNYRSKMEIRNNTILLESMVDKLPAVKIGDEVTAHLNNGTVSITFTATAKNDGKIGDEIRIVTKDNKLFYARVEDTGNVIIVE
jgi:flagellar basal body P-ring formation protein FlgA